MIFGKKEKPGPQYVGPYHILSRIRKVSYELKFPMELVIVHPMIHISMLNMCVGDPSLVVFFIKFWIDG